MPRALPIYVHSSIDDLTDLTPNAMRVYMHLARRADESGVAWPSYQAVGDHCFKSVSENAATRKSFARKAIDELIAAGVISKESRAREDGGQTSNGYLLSTVDSSAPPVLIKHPPMPISTPVLNGHGPSLLSTPRAYKGTEDTPYEDTPSKELDGDDNGSRKRMGAVYDVWIKNIPGTIGELLGEKLGALVDECGEENVIYGIGVAIEANARNFKYIAACARNRAAGRSSPLMSGNRGKNGASGELGKTHDEPEYDPEIQRRVDEHRERRKAEGSSFFSS